MSGATVTGGAAWLRALLVVLLIAFAAPALALADDSATAVVDPGVAATDTTSPDGATTDGTTADDAAAPATVPDATAGDPGTATYGADGSSESSSPVDQVPPDAPPPPAAEEPTPAPAPSPPPVAEVPPPVVVTIPTAPDPATPVITPTAPPATHPPATHPPVLDVDLPIDLLPLPGAAPATPEVVPTVPTGGVTAPLPVMAPVLSLPPTPGDPGDARTATLPTPSIPPFANLPTPGVAAALGVPNAPPGPTIAPPAPPLGALIGAAADGFPPDARHYLSDLTNGLLTPQGVTPGSAGGATSSSVAPTPPSFGTAVEDTDFVQPMVIPVGAAPSGSSLLAALAGYVLPGGSGAPPSTLVLFIVLGLILGVSYGAFPRLTERLATGRLMGACDGHDLAVCRPG